MTRHEVRELALQALYQMDVGKSDSFLAIQYVLEEKHPSDTDLNYLQTLVQGVDHHSQEIDDLLIEYIEGWELGRIARTDLNVLRLAVFELIKEMDVDMATIVNEAVELAKDYGSANSGKFVNGVLAKLLPTAASRRGL